MTEFSADYAPPVEVTNLEGMKDLSWHNDTCPSFGVYRFRTEAARIPGDLRGPERKPTFVLHLYAGDYVELRIWCDHPDPGLARFSLTA
jgi:hypothetical protein